jgi:hypothetical protein
MRLTKLPFLALALCFMFACSKKEDVPTPASANELKGSWKATDISYTGTSTTSVSGVTASSNFTGTGYDLNLTIKFDENPNIYTTSGNYSIKLATNINGQTINQNYTNQSFLDGGSWSKQGNELSITSKTNGAIQKATILEHTGTTLKLGYNTTQTTQQNGASVSVTIATIYIFNRL